MSDSVRCEIEVAKQLRYIPKHERTQKSMLVCSLKVTKKQPAQVCLLSDGAQEAYTQIYIIRFESKRANAAATLLFVNIIAKISKWYDLFAPF